MLLVFILRNQASSLAQLFVEPDRETVVNFRKHRGIRWFFSKPGVCVNDRLELRNQSGPQDQSHFASSAHG